VEEKDDRVSKALARNVQRLRGGRAIETLRMEMAEAGYHIGAGTLHRAGKGDLGMRVESLVKLGEFFNVTAVQLLQPGLGAEADGWPFASDLAHAVGRLDAEDLKRLEGVMRAGLKALAPKSEPIGQESRT
jgi:hypothetical protein